ncbi:feruloyl-CoA synthase [Thetidibacter halocola]|uniref:Feruloyl-CoA synthase n=1 Tax=Thetidibacter halocola TaxID=2827239 RepID=A0A8J8B8X9_9RHOB|nr:feruloyl-CoA synthase [Thetidibacter halocola]MBS0125254.1 feruloyl-CoA synthase [Thetidibacter halocola]
MAAYRPHAVIREDRADGSILLRSANSLGPVAAKTADWLRRWAELTPDAVFLAERSGGGWRAVTYVEALQAVRALAAALLERGMGAQTPILMLSGNGVDHGLLALAAQYVGVPTVPLAEPYSLIPAARPQLEHCARLIPPAMVFAADGARFAAGLAVFGDVERVVSRNAPSGATLLADLLRATGAVEEAAAQVGPDTVAKYLMTSGSTSSPKAVITTQRMMCANQAQIAGALPFLEQHPPRIVDWLPWNHVFGGSHNFNMMLAHGGALYIDGGKPVPALIGETIENNRMVGGTIAFNVPVGFAMLRDAMRADAALRERYFRDLDMLFYAGASLPQDVWDDLEEMAQEVRGEVPLFTSSWGLTETAPACLLQHEPTRRSGVIGVPLGGVEVKLIPEDEGRCEIRVRGPNVMPGYFRDPERTAAAFDDEGFFVTGDAVRFVDPDDPDRGLHFDGRISEDFKLTSGTWVRAATLRLELLTELGALAQDLVICGEGRDEIGLMIVPGPAVAGHAPAEVDGALMSDGLAQALRARLAGRAGLGSSLRVARVMVLPEPPDIGEGEITAKGNLNFRRILTRRSALLERLYAGGAGVVKIDTR